jgi:hypothetical protein
MPSTNFRLLARDLRARAEEIQARADTFHDEDARLKLLGIAWTYEKMAQRLEKEWGGADKA